MLRTVLASALALLSFSALAQMTPVGLWRTVDEKTGEPKSEIRITDTGGVLSGKVEKLLRKDAKPDEKCDKCTDDRKDKPILGMEIIRGAKKADGHDVWESGKILDPENGKEYTLKLTPVDGGKQLQVRGYIGFFFRTQTWVRAQ